jgi:hypothetical protein
VGNAAFSPDKIFIYENLGQVNLLAGRGSKKRNKTGYPGVFLSLENLRPLAGMSGFIISGTGKTVSWLKKKRGGKSKMP